MPSACLHLQRSIAALGGDRVLRVLLEHRIEERHRVAKASQAVECVGKIELVLMITDK